VEKTNKREEETEDSDGGNSKWLIAVMPLVLMSHQL